MNLISTICAVLVHTPTATKMLQFNFLLLFCYSLRQQLITVIYLLLLFLVACVPRQTTMHQISRSAGEIDVSVEMRVVFVFVILHELFYYDAMKICIEFDEFRNWCLLYEKYRLVK